MRTLLTAIAIALAAGAGYLGGYLREHRRLESSEAQAQALDARLAEARSLLGIHSLYDQVQDLMQAATDDGRYSQAQALSTELFDAVRAQGATVRNPRFKEALDAVLGLRDRVTAALAKRDPSVSELLGTIRKLLHPLLLELGTATPASAPSAAAPSRDEPPQRPAPEPAR